MFFFSFFIRQATSELPQPIAHRRETLPHDRNLGALYNASPKIRGALRPKKLGAQNMQNSARFQTTSNFDRECHRSGSSHPKSESILIESDSSRVLRKKRPVNFWSTNYRVLDVSWAHPNCIFQETIFWPLGVLPTQILTRTSD